MDYYNTYTANNHNYSTTRSSNDMDDVFQNEELLDFLGINTQSESVGEDEDTDKNCILESPERGDFLLTREWWESLESVYPY